MYIILLSDRSNLTVDDKAGRAILSEIYKERKYRAEYLNINGGMIKTSLINKCTPFNEEEQNIYYKETVREYHKNRKTFLDLEPSKKSSESIPYIKCFLFGLKGTADTIKTVYADIKDDIIEWFIQHPTRTILSSEWLTEKLGSDVIPYSNEMNGRLRQSVLKICTQNEITDIDVGIENKKFKTS